MQIWNYSETWPSLLVAATAIVAGSFFVSKWILRRRDHEKTKGTPRPPILPEGPPIQEFGQVNMKYQLNRFQHPWAKKYGLSYLVKSPLKPIIPDIAMIGDPKVVKQLLLKEAISHKRFTTRDQLIAWAATQGHGDSITAMTGDEWLWRRQALQKEFHKSRMGDARRGLLRAIVQTGDKLCGKLQEASKSTEPIKVDNLMTQSSVEIILYFLFGRPIPFDHKVFSSSVYIMVDTVVKLAMNPLHYFLRYIPFSSFWEIDRKRDAAWKAIDDTVRDEINIVLKELESKKPAPDRNYGAALPSLLEKEPRYRQEATEALVAEVRVLVFAGFETTSHALSFAFGMLASHPDVADQISKEGNAVRDLLQSGDAEQIQRALDSAPMAKHFTMEALRLYPPVPVLPGKCLDDIVISTSQDEKYLLEKGTQVLFANMVINCETGGDSFNLTHWDAPAAEQPFLNTFNNGEHICPGKSLSLLEAHIFLLMAATKFRFAFPNGDETRGMEFMDHNILQPASGMPLIVTER